MRSKLNLTLLQGESVSFLNHATTPFTSGKGFKAEVKREANDGGKMREGSLGREGGGRPLREHPDQIIEATVKAVKTVGQKLPSLNNSSWPGMTKSIFHRLRRLSSESSDRAVIVPSVEYHKWQQSQSAWNPVDRLGIGLRR